MRWLTETPVAHRGLHDLGRGRAENTASAFRAALKAGYAIECDVGLSADGVPVVFHDDSLGRLTGVDGPLESRTAAELMALPVLGTRDTVPPLADLLGLVAGKVPLLIELKGGRGRRGRLEPAVARLLAGYRGPVAIQSFDPAMVTWFRRHAPGVLRGRLTSRRGAHTATHAASPARARAWRRAPAWGVPVRERVGAAVPRALPARWRRPPVHLPVVGACGRQIPGDGAGPRVVLDVGAPPPGLARCTPRRRARSG